MKNAIKFLGIIVLATIIGFTMTGCIRGTYTYRGNTATLTYEGETVGTATVSRNTLTANGTYGGDSLTVTATKVGSNTFSNPFVGTWIGTDGDGEAIEIIISDISWALFYIGD